MITVATSTRVTEFLLVWKTNGIDVRHLKDLKDFEKAWNKVERETE